MRTHVNLIRSLQELFNEYFFTKIGVEQAENEPLKAWRRFGGNLEIWRVRKSSSSSKYLEFEMRAQGTRLAGGFAAGAPIVVSTPAQSSEPPPARHAPSLPRASEPSALCLT